MTQSTQPTATKANKPVSEIRYGAIKATIWENQHENGNFFSIDIYRIYKDAQGQWQKTTSFSLSDLPKVEKVAEDAYREIYRLRGAEDSPESLPDAA